MMIMSSNNKYDHAKVYFKMDPEEMDPATASQSSVLIIPEVQYEMHRKPSELHLDEIIHDAKNEHNFTSEENKHKEEINVPSDLPAPLPLLSFHETHQSDVPYRDVNPPKTGTGLPMMTKTPEFLEDVEPYEPIWVIPEGIQEECLKREAERVAHQENLMNRVVYDCIDPSPHSTTMELPEGELAPYYIPTTEEDCTLVFESRYESGNLRRAVQVYEFEYDLILKPDYNTRGNT